MNNRMTKKQIDLIKAICTTLEMEFRGSTSKDASKFISENIKEFQKEMALSQILYENYGFLD